MSAPGAKLGCLGGATDCYPAYARLVAVQVERRPPLCSQRGRADCAQFVSEHEACSQTLPSASYIWQTESLAQHRKRCTRGRGRAGCLPAAGGVKCFLAWVDLDSVLTWSSCFRGLFAVSKSLPDGRCVVQMFFWLGSQWCYQMMSCCTVAANGLEERCRLDWLFRHL